MTHTKYLGFFCYTSVIIIFLLRRKLLLSKELHNWFDKNLDRYFALTLRYNDKLKFFDPKKTQTFIIAKVYESASKILAQFGKTTSDIITSFSNI